MSDDLRHEQQFLLRSLRDLDNEREAGDIDDAEFREKLKQTLFSSDEIVSEAHDQAEAENEAFDFANIPPKCKNDDEILKPDFIFFGSLAATSTFLTESAAFLLTTNPPEVEMRATIVSTSTVSFSLTIISASVPSTGEGTSVSTLSVLIS